MDACDRAVVVETVRNATYDMWINNAFQSMSSIINVN